MLSAITEHMSNTSKWWWIRRRRRKEMMKKESSSVTEWIMNHDHDEGRGR
jgi:hypothetical protein